MSSVIKSPKDFWTGVLYFSFGAVAFWVARDYSFGTASRMGAGYFPTVLSGLLMFFGVGVGTLLYNEQAAIARKPKGHDFDYSRQQVAGQVSRHMSHTGG